MNISIPGDVKRLMNKAKEDVNWSAIATQAFRTKLGEIAAKKEKKSMEDVINRLRELKSEEGSEMYQEGVIWGEEWVRYFATPKELDRLERCWDSYSANLAVGSSAYSEAEHLAFQILGIANYPDRQQAENFWEVIFGDNVEEMTDDLECLRGFGNGALELWGRLKAKI